MIIEIALSPCENSSIDICLDRSLSADKVLPLSEDSSKLHVFFTTICTKMSMFVMRFSL